LKHFWVTLFLKRKTFCSLITEVWENALKLGKLGAFSAKLGAFGPVRCLSCFLLGFMAFVIFTLSVFVFT
jgi:hypothetical protein